VEGKCVKSGSVRMRRVSSLSVVTVSHVHLLASVPDKQIADPIRTHTGSLNERIFALPALEASALLFAAGDGMRKGWLEK
jgi:hypothetical protein